MRRTPQCAAPPPHDRAHEAARGRAEPRAARAIQGRMSRWSIVEQVLGTLLFLFVLLDVFMTVLYARLGSHGVARLGAGVIGNAVGRSVHVVLSRLPAPRGRRDAILSFCGPLTVVLLLGAWSWGLGIGGAMMLQPYLGDAIQVQGSPTPTGFVAALYAAGTSLSVTGSSEFQPRTEWMRMLYLVNSLVGATIVTLSVTYLMQLYSSLQRRNTLALDVHLYTSETGDAAELIAALAPLGDFGVASGNAASIARGMTAIEEAHHFYPVLFYFRPATPERSLIRVLLVCLDAVSLMRTALSERDCARIGNSATVIQLWRASLVTAEMLESTFLSEGGASDYHAPEDAKEKWRARYRAAHDRLARGGVAVREDVAAGAERYVAVREQWQRRIEMLAGHMGFPYDKMDPASTAAS
jgi:hypothetical protein